MTRIERLAEGLARLDCDAAVLVGAEHVVHVVGYSRLYSGPAAVLLDREGHTTLFVPSYEIEVAAPSSTAHGVVGYGDGGFGLDPDPTAQLADTVVGALCARRIGVGAGAARHLEEAIVEGAGAEAVPIAELVDDVRVVKDDDELERIAAAYRLCLVAQDSVSAAPAGSSEIELYSAAHAAAQNDAGKPVGFGADILVGSRSASVGGPVAVAGEATLGSPDHVLADIAAELDGYWGDTARTWIRGDLPEVEAITASVTDVLVETADRLRPGVRASDVFAVMAGELARRHPRGLFPHHAGHGVGLRGLERPRLTPWSDDMLAAGMVVAVEPGVYFPGRFGVRVENTYVVTEEGSVEVSELRRRPARARGRRHDERSIGGSCRSRHGGSMAMWRAVIEASLAVRARVAVLDVDPRDADLAAVDDGQLVVRLCDVRREREIDAAVSAIRDAPGTVDVLVNNAGVNAYFDAAAKSEPAWDHFMAVDLKSAWLYARHVPPGMCEPGRGAIINVSSIYSIATSPRTFPCAAAKRGLFGLTRSGALDYTGPDVRINSVCPGFVRTRLVDDWVASQPDPDAAEREMFSSQPMGRIGPAEIAKAAVFLASDDANFVTGADGGLSARIAA